MLLSLDWSFKRSFAIAGFFTLVCFGRWGKLSSNSFLYSRKPRNDSLNNCVGFGFTTVCIWLSSLLAK